MISSEQKLLRGFNARAGAGTEPGRIVISFAWLSSMMPACQEPLTSEQTITLSKNPGSDYLEMIINTGKIHDAFYGLLWRSHRS
jgi:hypothetical protein